MKKLLTIVAFFLILAWLNNQAFSYDQTFPSQKIRLGIPNYFSDKVINNYNTRIWVSMNPAHGGWISFNESEDYNQNGTDNGTTMYNYTNEIVTDNYIINDRDSTQVVILNSPYTVTKIPSTRKSNNIEIVYRLAYWKEIDWSFVKSPTTHTEYQPYEITWCGDNVRDDYTSQQWDRIFEQCDDGNNINGDGCSSTCEIEPEPVAVCNTLITTPSSWISPLTSNVTCSWTDVNSYRIDCWNGTSVNAATGSCNYSDAWSYTASCYVDGQTTTSAACQKPITVNSEESDAVCNTLTVAPNIWDAPLNSTVTCSWTDVNSYRIDCWNGTSVNAATGSCNYPDEWNYIASCYINGETTTAAACMKTVTVTPSETIWVCNTLTATPNSWNAPLSSNLTCSWTDVSSYRIDCWNGTSVNAATGSCNYPDEWNYIASCYVDGQTTTSTSCQQTLTVNTPLTFCWDGTIQTPNDAWFTEQCDDGNNNNWDGCSATCTIEPFVPSISIDKTDANPIDFDTIIWNDTQTIASGWLAIFKITLTNNGTDDLRNLVVTDGFGPKCWGSIPLPALPITFMSGSLSWSWNHTDNIFQIWETLEYYCDADKSDESYTNTISVTADWILSWNSTLDSDISQVVLQVPTPVIQIVKTDNNPGDLDLDIWGNDSQTVSSWSVAIFNITVTNIWTEDLNTVAITDPLVAACWRTNIETLALIQAIWNLDTVFNIGESFTYNCTDPIYTGAYPINTAWVRAIWVTSLTPVTDTDTSLVILSTVPVVPVCTNLTVSQNSGSSPYDPTYNCTWSNATSFNVRLIAPDGTITNTAGASGTFNINQQWTYSASCFVNGLTTTPQVCSKTMNYSTGWGWGWGWWTTPRCNQATFNDRSVTCDWNSKITSFKFTCQNGTELSSETNSLWDAVFSIWDCWVWASTMNYTGAECRAFNNTFETDSRKACQYDPGGWGWPRCWDGAVQTYRWEECDDGNTVNRDGCNSSCELDTVTNPYGWAITITAFEDIVMIGDWMDPYEIHNLSVPVLKNTWNTDNDLVLEQFCAYSNENNSSLNWPSTTNPTCQNIPGWILYPGESVALVWLRGKYEWNISWIPWINKTDDNDIIYTVVEAGGNHSLAAHYNKDLTVRVVKPTITTTWWGTSYIRNTNLSDLKNIGAWVSGVSNNTNYVWAGIWNNLSSSSKDNIDTTQSEAEWNTLETEVEDKIESITTDDDWVNYNGMDNVYYINWNYPIDSLFDVNKNPIDNSQDTASKTYIIDGNLTINSDITGYPASLAFIVKWGNIIIWENVKNLQWTYIALPDSDWNFWKINWGGNSTINVLHVKGSMYWNNTDLLSKRTYIKNNSSGQIDVGTIVSFGSSVFRKPAPLTTKFINDYLETTKVAQ